MKKAIGVILILSSVCSTVAFGQKKLKLNKHLKSQKKIEKMDKNVEDKFNEFIDFKHVKASITSEDDLSGMNIHEKEFKYPFSVETVWNSLADSSPQELFAGPKVHFGKVYSEESDKVYNRTDKNVPKLEKGMTIINYLTIGWGMIRMSVTVKIVAVDVENKILELAYSEGNTSSGTQILTFNEVDGKTVIHHKSYYKSSSKIRDIVAYKGFHLVTIGEFHDTLLRKIESLNP
jgi:hypothetical protein